MGLNYFEREALGRNWRGSVRRSNTVAAVSAVPPGAPLVAVPSTRTLLARKEADRLVAIDRMKAMTIEQNSKAQWTPQQLADAAKEELRVKSRIFARLAEMQVEPEAEDFE
jgi:hypothetical protein